MTAEVIDLGANENMTPEQALAVAARKPWEKVLIVGFTEDADGLVVMSSRMPRESALWIARHLDLHIIGQLDD